MKFDPSTIPPRMQHLPRDRRGLPIPVIVLRDKNGDPHFTINVQAVAMNAFKHGLCSICGGKLGTHKWFVGGPGAAFHPKGRYIDGPLHQECGLFALKTCPYLALAGTYSKRIDAKTLKPGARPEGMVFHDPTMHPPQPAVFVFADTTGYEIMPRTGHLTPARPWTAVRFFRGGEEITSDEAREIVANDPTAVVPIEELNWQAR